MADLRLALRTLARNPGFTAVAVLTLGLSIGATTSVFGVVYGVLHRPLPYHDPSALVLIDGVRRFAGGQRPEHFSAADIPAWAGAAPLASLAGHAEIGQALDARGSVEPVTAALVSERFFATLGQPPAAGRLLEPQDDLAPVVVLSHRLWLRLFDGRADAIGHAVVLGDRTYTIVGVAAADFRFPSAQVDVWAPMGHARESGLAPWLGFKRGGGVTFVARLRPDATVAQARAALHAFAQALAAERGEADRPHEPVVTSMGDAAAAGVGPALRLFLAALVLVLLVAAGNVANLMLARHATRDRDVAVRLALGASRRRLLVQASSEGLLIGAMGSAGGVGIAVAVVRALTWWAPPQVPRLDAIRVDWPVLAFAAAVGVLVTLLSSVVPALALVRRDTAAALGASPRMVGRTRAERLRSLLVAAELAVSILLLVGTSVLMRSFVRLLQVDLGARTDHVLVARLDLSLGRTLDATRQRALAAQLVERSRALPGVESAALGASLPPSGRLAQLTLKDVAAVDRVLPEYTAVAAPVTPDFFATLGVPLLEGRSFEEQDDVDHPRVLVVSADVARDLFGGHALGRTFTLPTTSEGNVAATVVGVVGNVRYGGLARPVEPTFYVPFAQQPWSTAFLVVRTAGDPATVATSLRGAIAAADRRVGVVGIRPLDAMVSDETAPSAFRTAVFSAVAGISVLLAAIGLAGVVGYSVSRRTSEIGLRMALGASPRGIASMVLREALWIGALGAAVGLAAAAALSRVMAGFVFDVSPGDPVSFVLAAVVLLAAIVAATLGPSWRASRVDPAAALRAE